MLLRLRSRKRVRSGGISAFSPEGKSILMFLLPYLDIPLLTVLEKRTGAFFFLRPVSLCCQT